MVPHRPVLLHYEKRGIAVDVPGMESGELYPV